jgi:radical SAM protein with 4Fe4S-binding SPASM domain
MKNLDFVVVWRLTEGCNLSCPFCLYDKKLGGTRKAADLKQILKFTKILGDYSHKTGRKTMISWLGGEPFLWPHIEQVTHHAAANNILISTTTNGTTLGAEKIRKHIVDHYSELTLSIDATGSLYEELRGWKNGYAKLREYTKLLYAERKAANSPLILKANIVLTHKTMPYFYNLCRELADWGIDIITFNQLGGRDRPEYYPENKLTAEDVDDLERNFLSLKCLLQERGVKLSGSQAYIDRIKSYVNEEKISIADCGPGKNFLFIDELGRISPCSYTSADYGLDVGMIEKPEDIQELQHLFKKKQAMERSQECDDCKSTQQFEKFT